VVFSVSFGFFFLGGVLLVVLSSSRRLGGAVNCCDFGRGFACFFVSSAEIVRAGLELLFWALSSESVFLSELFF